MATDEKSPLEQALELFVFAPLGLAVTARTQLPDLVAKGRTQLEGQLSLARFVGQFAVKQAKVEVEKRIKAYTEQPAPPPPEPPEPEPLSVRTSPLAEPAPPDPPRAAPELGPAPPAADLAIPGYDALSASQVVQRLAGLSSAELEQVRAYEAGTRGRKTVLTKVSQLQVAKPQVAKPQVAEPQ